jgi:hypothetical protein
MQGEPDRGCNLDFRSRGERPDMKHFLDVLTDNLWSRACYRQRRGREIFIEQKQKDFPAPFQERHLPFMANTYKQIQSAAAFRSKDWSGFVSDYQAFKPASP